MTIMAPLTSGQGQKLRQLNDAFTVDRQLETLTGLSLRMAGILPLTTEKQPLAIAVVDRMHDPGPPPPAVPPRSRDPPNRWFSEKAPIRHDGRRLGQKQKTAPCAISKHDQDGIGSSQGR